MQAEWKHNSISMRWCCKIYRCSSPNQRALITHYKLKHCHQASHCPLPCLYKDCVCTFRSELSLKKHLTCDHSQCVQASSKLLKATSNVNCDLCNFLFLQLIRSKRYEDIPEITSILESLDKDVSQFILKQSFSPQNDNSVISYSLSCLSKPLWPFFSSTDHKTSVSNIFSYNDFRVSV